MSIHSRSIVSSLDEDIASADVADELDRALKTIGRLFPSETDTPRKKRDMALRIALTYLEVNGISPDMLSIVATPNEEQ